MKDRFADSGANPRRAVAGSALFSPYDAGRRCRLEFSNPLTSSPGYADLHPTVQSSDTACWDAFVRAHQHGSPFHLTAWKRSIEETFGYQPLYLLAEEEGRLRGVLPLFLVRNLLGKALISSPFAVYGGPLADAPDVARSLSQCGRMSTGSSLGVGYAELRNAYPDQCVGFSPRRPVRHLYAEHRPRRAKPSSRPSRAKTRAAVRKSLKNPFSTDRTTDPARIRGPLLPQSAPSRHALLPFPPLFDALAAFSGECDVFEVILEDKVVAAVFTFYFRDQVLPYYRGLGSALTPSCRTTTCITS